MIETGTLLHERFLIEAQIGVGGMGAVYRATDQKFGSAVAIKETFFNDPELAEAFEREARLLNGLHHPIFPHVSDHFMENDGHFLVMEYIEGEDLSEVIKRGEPFDLDTITRWTFDLLDGLDYLHSQDPPIIHRDIKPSNLKLTSRGNIVLLDFGMAKETSGNTQGMRSVFGYSRRYSPLEQIEGTGTDFRSDIFSLCSTVYHLLTGTPPIDVLKRASAIVARKPDPLTRASDVNPNIPGRVAAIIHSGLELNPDERFISARAMWDALKHAVTAETTPDAASVAAVKPREAEVELASESSFPALEAFEAEVHADVGESPAVAAFRSVSDDYEPIAALVAQRVSQMKAADAGQGEKSADIQNEVPREPIIEPPAFVHAKPDPLEVQDLGSLDTKRERIVVPVLDQEPSEIDEWRYLGVDDDREGTDGPPPPSVAPNGYVPARRFYFPALIGIPLILLVFGILGYALVGSSASGETAAEAPSHENAGPADDSVASQPLPETIPEPELSSTEESTSDPSSEAEEAANDSPPDAPQLSEELEASRSERQRDGVSEPARASETRTQPENKRSQLPRAPSEPAANSQAARSTRPRLIDDDSSPNAPVSSIESIMTGIPTDRTRRQQQRQWEVWEEDELRRERRQRRINRRNRQNRPPF